MGSMVFCELPRIVREYGVRPFGLVQVGAHTGEELDAFFAAGVRHCLCFEPNPSAADAIEHRLPSFRGRGICVELYRCAIGPANLDEAYLRVPQRSQLGSLANLKADPEDTYSHIVKMRRLDRFTFDGFGILVVDTQGTELDVLRSAGDKLQQFEMLIVEIDHGDRYVGSDHITLLKFIHDAGFKEVCVYPHDHDPMVSDRVYIKK